MLQHLSALVSSLAHAHLLPEIPELGQPRGAELTDRLSPIAPEAHSNLLISRLQQARGELQKPSNESGSAPLWSVAGALSLLGQKAELGFSRVQTRGPRLGNVGMTGRTAIAKCGLPATKLVPVLGTSKQPQHAGLGIRRDKRRKHRCGSLPAQFGVEQKWELIQPSSAQFRH
jgi:hypothetical protein